MGLMVRGADLRGVLAMDEDGARRIESAVGPARPGPGPMLAFRFMMQQGPWAARQTRDPWLFADHGMALSCTPPSPRPPGDGRGPRAVPKRWTREAVVHAGGEGNPCGVPSNQQKR